MDEATRIQVEKNAREIAEYTFATSPQRNKIFDDIKKARQKGDKVMVAICGKKLDELKVNIYKALLKEAYNMDACVEKAKRMPKEKIDALNDAVGTSYMLADMLSTSLAYLKVQTDHLKTETGYNPFAMMDVQELSRKLTLQLQSIYIDAPKDLLHEFGAESDRLFEIVRNNARSAFRRAEKKSGL